MIALLKTPMGRLRIISFIEGVSLLAILFVTMPLKYLYSTPEPNKILGALHGFFSVVYFISVINIKIAYDWSIKKMIIALLGSIIPFGTFVLDAKQFKPEYEQRLNS